MATNTKKKEVISENTKGKTKKVVKKDNNLKKIINTIKKYKKVFISGISIVFISLIVLIVVNNFSSNYEVITINGVDYYNDDFMIYLYSAKYNYFKKEDITEDDLKVVIDNDSNMTVKEYLKETALSDLKTSSAIRKMADDNNIVLNDEELEELDKEKKDFIKMLTGLYMQFTDYRYWQFLFQS